MHDTIMIEQFVQISIGFEILDLIKGVLNNPLREQVD